MDANLGPSALDSLLKCIEGWVQISGLRPSKIRCLALRDGCMLGPSARALLRAFGPRPQTPRPSASDLRPSKLFCLASSDGWKSRAFGPRKSVAFQRWMDARAFGPRTAGLRPAVWGPSAPKPLTHKISTFCNFVQNGQKIPRPSASVCSGLGPRSAGLRPAVWGPSAPKPPTSKISTFCNFVQNGQKILQKIFLYSAR